MAVISQTEFVEGSLSLGAQGTLRNIATRVKSISLNVEHDKEDDTYVLSGDIIPGKASSSYALELTLAPDLGQADSVWEYFWDNDGANVPFEFVPFEGSVRKVTGTLTVRSAGISGDANAAGETEVELPILGKPVVSAVETSGV